MQHSYFRPAAFLAVAVALVLGACDSTAPVQEDTYNLVSVNAHVLPAPHPQHDALEITAGSLTLRQDGTAVESLTIRCRADLPPTTQCAVTQPTQQRTGTYSAAEGWVVLEGATYPIEQAGGRITAEYGPPPSMGVFARATFVYER
jgi:hypothetical protein